MRFLILLATLGLGAAIEPSREVTYHGRFEALSDPLPVHSGHLPGITPARTS
jgi:hypothetical protein